MSASGGRKRGREWAEVTFENDDGNEKIHCNHCNEVLSKKIERIRNHLSSCIEYKKSRESEFKP